MSVPITSSSTSLSNIITVKTVHFVGLPPKNDILFFLREILFYDTTYIWYTNKYQLSTESIQHIKIMLHHSPTLFFDIAKELKEITEDNQFNSHEIPHIIKIIKDVVRINIPLFAAVGRMSSDCIAQFIRTLLLLLIQSQYIWTTHNREVAILLNIDACIDLLVSKLDIKGKRKNTCLPFC